MDINPKTLFVGHNHIHLSEIDSTNLYAAEYIAKNIHFADGTLITTKFQNNGNGRMTNKWHSSYGKNILSSLLLKPHALYAHKAFRLNCMISCSIHYFLAKYVHPSRITIKWPNDIYIDNKKVAGILIQNSLRTQYIVSSIVGIGININETSFPTSIPNAISLADATNKYYDLVDLYDEFCIVIEQYYLLLRSKNYKNLYVQYLANLYRKNELSEFLIDQQIVNGIIQYVDEYGRLVVMINGQEKKYFSNEIKII